jgi:hypothetical protein
VWRASLCDWFCRGQTYQQIDLGPYLEEIRRYLKGEIKVPQQIGVMVVLSGLEQPVLGMSFPGSYRVELSHCYRFQIPGVTFVATVGGCGSPEDQSSILRSPNPIFVGKDGDRLAQDAMMRLMGRTPPRGYEAPLVNGTERIT